MKRIKVMLACVAVAGLTVLNFTQSRASFMRNTMASSSSESSETDTSTDASTASSSSTSGSQMGPLAWSDQIKCQTGGRGKYYRVCQEYGRANSCDRGGVTTCVCGMNCEYGHISARLCIIRGRRIFSLFHKQHRINENKNYKSLPVFVCMCSVTADNGIM